MDGPKKFYSARKYNLNVGFGDRQEILSRRTWRELDYWQSDDVLMFGGAAVWNGKSLKVKIMSSQ